MYPPLLRCALGICLSLLNPYAHAQQMPQELTRSVPGAVMSGQFRMTFWGFDVYKATLWIAAGFNETAFEQGSFGLELLYLRDFKGADIARRSLVEMRRQGPLPAEQEAAWESQMRNLFPDVKNGDRIVGVNQPGVGATFWCNGRPLGDVKDPEFAKKFFGIWLSSQTSEPALRRALLGSATPSAKSPANLANATSTSGTP